MGFSDGEELSQLYLELVDAYKKRSMPQNGQVALLKCSSIWKKMSKSFKIVYGLKAQVHSQKRNLEMGNYGCISSKRKPTFLMEK